MSMTMEYIRRTYGVPAKRGMMVTICGDGVHFQARIVGSRGQYLRLWIAGGKRSHLYHPTDSITYPTHQIHGGPLFCSKHGGYGFVSDCVECSAETPNARLTGPQRPAQE
jgi:hypothetical protein